MSSATKDVLMNLFKELTPNDESYEDVSMEDIDKAEVRTI